MMTSLPNRPTRAAASSSSANKKQQQQPTSSSSAAPVVKKQSAAAAPAASRYPKKPPKIDAQAYQATVPPGPFLRQHVQPRSDHPDLQMVCSGSTAGEVYDYLDFCRRLTGSHALGQASSVPLEEDENALEFLTVRAGGSVDRAKLLLIASLDSSGGGGGGGRLLSSSSLGAPPPPSSLAEWTAQAQRALEGEEGVEAHELAALVAHGRLLVSADSDAARVVLNELESQLELAEQFAAKVHAALSGCQRRRTVSELRLLAARQAPKRVRMREQRVVLELCDELDAWEQSAGEDWWNSGSSSSSSSRDFARLPVLLQQARDSVADHGAIQTKLERALHEYEACRMRLAAVLPSSSSLSLKAWKRKHGAAKLAVLEELQQAMRTLRMPASEQLDSAVSGAQEWIAQSQACVNSPSLKDVQQLVARVDALPVDLEDERRPVDRFLAAAQDFVKRAKSFFASSSASSTLAQSAASSSSTLSAAAQKKLAKQQLLLQQQQQQQQEAETGDSASFLALREEMLALGLGQVEETEQLRDALDAVAGWLGRVRTALDEEDGKLATLQELERELAKLPVSSVHPEDRELQQRVAKLAWSQRARALLDSLDPPPSIAALELALAEADTIMGFSSASQLLPPAAKRTKRGSSSSTATTATTKREARLDGEDEVEARLQEYRAWLAVAELVLQRRRPVDFGDFITCRAGLAQCQHLLLQGDKQQPQRRTQQLVDALQDVDVARRDARRLLRALLPPSSSHLAGLHEQDVEEAPPPAPAPLLMADFKQLVHRHEQLGVRTPERSELEHFNRELDHWHAEYSDALRPLRKLKRADLPYRVCTLRDLAKLREIVDHHFTRVVDLSSQLAELDECMRAGEEFHQALVGHAGLSVEHCLRLFPATSSAADNDTSAEEDGRLLVRLGVMRPDASLPPPPAVATTARMSLRKFEATPAQSDALVKAMLAMKDAEKKEWHLQGVTNQPAVRLAAWLIKAYMWIQRVDLVLNSSSSYKPAVLCQYVLDGARLLRRFDGCGEILPNAVLDQLLLTPTPPAAGASLDVYYNHAEDEWSMLRHIQPLHVLDDDKDEGDGWACNSLAGDVHVRLAALRTDLQSYFAAKFACKYVIAKLPTRRKTAETLREMLSRLCPQRRYAQDSLEEAKLKGELAASEAWSSDLATKRFDASALDKAIARGQKLWVDASQVDVLRQRGKRAHEWQERVRKALDANAVQPSAGTIDALRVLLVEGERDVQSVDVTGTLDQVRRAVDLVCMCRAPRHDHHQHQQQQLMRCEDCHEDFHRECLRQHYTSLCPYCQVFREVDRMMGRAMAAVCRVALLKTSSNEQDQLAMCAYVTHVLQPALAQVESSTVLPLRCEDERFRDCIEVRALEGALECKKWALQLANRRHRPTLEDLETLIRGRPASLRNACIEGLVAICNRGKLVLDAASQIWNLPLSTPSAVIVDRCEDALRGNKYLPLDMGQMTRALEACVNDNAQRHCSCRRFDDGGMMLNCVRCDQWFHAQCVGVKKVSSSTSSTTSSANGGGAGAEEEEDDEEFCCPRCELEHRLHLPPQPSSV